MNRLIAPVHMPVHMRVFTGSLGMPKILIRCVIK